jgi:DNA-binding CsgD family transcriptional regulator
MCGGLPEWMLAAMNDRPIRLGLELRLTDHSLTGRISDERGVDTDLADSCGAEGLAEEIRTELRAAGVRPRTAALAGVESLTASERRVADLAADGRTNREIAQELYVTPKTVEVHLSNAYRKLDIRSRRELPEALA